MAIPLGDLNAQYETIKDGIDEAIREVLESQRSISRLGADPVFLDIDPKTCNTNPQLIEKRITGKTKAIIPVHLYGQCADMDPVLEVAKKFNLE